MGFTITRHAKERYAERIMDRDNKTDVAVFIKEHDDKIQRDIEKMIQFGNTLYVGPSTKDPRKKSMVVQNGSWVVIIDPDNSSVITLYKIDLGVGDEANEVFIANALKRINETYQKYEAEQNRVTEYITAYENNIAHDEEYLVRYRKLVKDLEQHIGSCREMIRCAKTDVNIAENEWREAIETLIGKQHF